MRTVAKAKIYVREQDAYRGRVKLHGGKGGVTAYELPDGPEGVIRLGNVLRQVCEEHPHLLPGKADGSLHSIRIQFAQECDAEHDADARRLDRKKDEGGK